METVWDVPHKWRDHLTLPDPPPLSTEEKLALRALKEALKNPIAYTPPRAGREGRDAGPKRSRHDREAGSKRPTEETEILDETPLEVMPLRVHPAEDPVAEAEPPKRRRLVKKADKRKESTQQELGEAEEASARTFQEEEPSRKNRAERQKGEEEDLQVALQASATEASAVVIFDVMDSPCTPETLQVENSAAPVGVATSSAEALEAGNCGEFQRSVCPSGSSSSAPAPPPAAAVPTAEAAGPSHPAAAPVAAAEASLTKAEEPPHPAPTRAPATRALPSESEATEPKDTEAKGAADSANEVPRSPPPAQPEDPPAAVGVHGSPLPERVRLARLKPSTVRPFPKPIRTEPNRQELAARAKDLMVEHAESGRATSQSPVDIAAVGSHRGEVVYRRRDLLLKVKGIKEAPGDSSTGGSPDLPKDEELAARMQIREVDKMPMPPINRQPERRAGGPLGPEVQPGDVAYDIHALSGLPQLSERDGRPILPGACSYDPRDRKASALHYISKIQLGMMSMLAGFVDTIVERETAREEETRQESFDQGKASIEKTRFLQSLALHSEVALFRNQACKADTLANLAVRERDAQAQRAAEAEARAKQLEEANDDLTRFAALEAEAAVQDKVDLLELRAQEAEESARRAELAREEAVERATLVRRQLEVSEARVIAVESEARASEEKADFFQEEVSRLSKKEAQLAAQVSSLLEKLEEAEATAKAVEAMAWQEGSRATAAEWLSAESLQRAKDAEAELAKARSETAPGASGEGVADLQRDVLDIQRVADDRAAAYKAQMAEAEEAKAALSSRVEDLQRSLEELKAKSEAEAKAAKIQEVRSNVKYFNAAVREIETEFPHLDLSNYLVPEP